MTSWALVILAGVGACAVFMLGSLICLARGAWSVEALHRWLALGSGLLIGAAAFHLIPGAARAMPPGDSGGLSLLGVGLTAGFLLTFMLEQWALGRGGHDHANPAQDAHFVGGPTIVAQWVHGVLDGVALGAGFRTSMSLGLAASMAVLLHKLTDGLLLGTLLAGSETPRPSALLYSFLGGIATLAGAIVSYALALTVTPRGAGLGLAFAAGVFLYVGASDILPRLHRGPALTTLGGFSAGLALMAAGALAH